MESPEAVIEKVRREVALRKGVPDAALPAMAPEKKSILQKAAAALERAKVKHFRVRKWPRLIRPLRRDQEAINEALITAAQALTQEATRVSRLAGPLAIQQAQLITRLQRAEEHCRTLAGRVEKLEAIIVELGRQQERPHRIFSK